MVLLTAGGTNEDGFARKILRLVLLEVAVGAEQYKKFWMLLGLSEDGVLMDAAVLSGGIKMVQL